MSWHHSLVVLQHVGDRHLEELYDVSDVQAGSYLISCKLFKQQNTFPDPVIDFRVNGFGFAKGSKIINHGIMISHTALPSCALLNDSHSKR